MKHLKLYENFNDIKSKVIDYLKSKWSEEKVDELFDEEVVGGNWVDDDWEDEYESEYDWYVDHNNGEAEDVIIDLIESDIIENIPNSKSIDLVDVIKEVFSSLNYT
jgi:hypothetical protein